MEPQGSHVAVPEAVGHTELSTTALARLLASGIRDELLAITREMSNATPRRAARLQPRRGRRTAGHLHRAHP